MYLYVNLGQPQNGSCSTENRIFGCKSTNDKVSLQSNLKFFNGDTLKSFELRVNNFYVKL